MYQNKQTDILNVILSLSKDKHEESREIVFFLRINY